MRLTAWALVIGIVLGGFMLLNNRVSYKYEADIAETLVQVHHGSKAQQQAVRARGQQLDREAQWIKAVMVVQGIGLVVLLVRLNRSAA